MKRTENLNLPIYDNPESDIFKVSDVNNAHETIDKQYKELKLIKETVESTNPSANLQGQINDINSSLEHKAKKRQIYYLSDYGKANDSTYDNTPALKQAIKDLQKTGGKLIIDTGTWEFKTPIIIDEWLFGCEIVGMSRGITNNTSDANAIRGSFGTILNYSGSGYMFTFNGKMNHCRIENIGVELSDNSYFATFNYTYHKGILKDIRVSGGLGCVNFNTGTYVHIDNLGYGSSVKCAEFGIRIGGDDIRYTTEFFYIRNTSIDFGHLSSANCIEILRCEGGIYIDKCDLCNTYGVGLKIENLLGASTNYYSVRDVNFTRCKTGIELYGKTGNIGGVFVNNVRFGLKCEHLEEKILYCHSDSPNRTSIELKGAYIRLYNSANQPTNIIDLSRVDYYSSIELVSGSTYDQGFTNPMKFQSDIRNFYDYRIDYQKTIDMNLAEYTPVGVGASWSDYKIELAKPYSMYYAQPIVNISCSYAIPIGVIKTEVQNGVLYGYLRIPSEVPSQVLRLHYNIIF